MSKTSLNSHKNVKTTRKVYFEFVVFVLFCRYNPFLDQGVSRYEFLFHMRRHKRAAFFKIFLPPLFIVLVVSVVKTPAKASLYSHTCVENCVYHHLEPFFSVTVIFINPKTTTYHKSWRWQFKKIWGDLRPSEQRIYWNYLNGTPGSSNFNFTLRNI